jgi:hypothetical protein
VIGVANDDRPRPGFDQSDTAENQGAHDPLAEVGLRDEQRAQLLRRNDEGVDRTLGVRVDEGRASGQLRQLAEEAAGFVCDDRVTPTQLVAPTHDDLARKDDNLPVTDLADPHEGVAGSV